MFDNWSFSYFKHNTTQSIKLFSGALSPVDRSLVCLCTWLVTLWTLTHLFTMKPDVSLHVTVSLPTLLFTSWNWILISLRVTCHFTNILTHLLTMKPGVSLHMTVTLPMLSPQARSDWYVSSVVTAVRTT